MTCLIFYPTSVTGPRRRVWPSGLRPWYVLDDDSKGFRWAVPQIRYQHICFHTTAEDNVSGGSVDWMGMNSTNRATTWSHPAPAINLWPWTFFKLFQRLLLLLSSDTVHTVPMIYSFSTVCGNLKLPPSGYTIALHTNNCNLTWLYTSTKLEIMIWMQRNKTWSRFSREKYCPSSSAPSFVPTLTVVHLREEKWPLIFGSAVYSPGAENLLQPH